MIVRSGCCYGGSQAGSDFWRFYKQVIGLTIVVGCDCSLGPISRKTWCSVNQIGKSLCCCGWLFQHSALSRLARWWWHRC